jgi:acetoacetyl-CoA synthetase
MSTVTEGTLLWEPSEETRQNSIMRAYMTWLEQEKGLVFQDYAHLWEWSTTDIEAFWESIWQYFQIKAHTPYERVLTSHQMPGAEWFPGATLNFAEHIFRHMSAAHPAILFQSEREPLREISWEELRRSVASVAASLRSMGVTQGDRVVGYIPNIPEAVVAFLACASIGAIWSSCSPDFGSASVIDRFKQIEPKILIAVDGYTYGGKPFERREIVTDLQQQLSTLEQTILLPYLNPDAATASAAQANCTGPRWHSVRTPENHSCAV